MANAANTQHEPTMEEILASIRKIISEDAPEPTVEAAAPPPPPAPLAPPPPMAANMAEMDVLELTEEIPDEKPAVHTPPPELSDDVIFEPIEEPAMPPAHDDDNEGIFSNKTRAATDSTFATIDVPEEAPVRISSIAPLPPLPPMDSSSIAIVFEHAVRHSFEPVLREWLGANSEVVIERMTPLIREWMDENFPPLVENAVRSEVARAVKARSKR